MLEPVDTCRSKDGFALAEPPSLFVGGDGQLTHLRRYLVIKNFLSRDEVNQIKAITENLPGYNAHVPVHSDKVLRVYDSNYPYNVLSYSPENFYKDSLVTSKM